MANDYYSKVKFVRDKVKFYLEEIFKVYGNELLLRLEEYNLLSNPNNVIESSTSTGFIMEEFITSKLEIYTINHNGIDDVKICKNNGLSTINVSYDCYTEYKDILFLINIKVQKKGANNNAVAAINILYNNYVLEQPDKIKSYLVIKTNYSFGKSQRDEERKILVHDIDAYALEEIDFSKGHKQDHRNWSEKYNPNSGRLQVTPKTRKENLLSEDEISYDNTKDFISTIYQNNESEVKKEKRDSI